MNPRSGFFGRLVGTVLVVAISGHAASQEEKRLRASTQSSVASNKSKTNGATSPKPANRLTTEEEQEGRIYRLAMMVFLSLLGLLILWGISRFTPRGTTLVLSLILLLGVNSLDPQNEDDRIAKAAIGLTGFGGLILGSLDFFLKKKKPKPRKPTQRIEFPVD